MNKHMTYSWFQRVAFALLPIFLSNTQLKGDYCPTSCSLEQSPEPGFFYSIDEPLDDFRSASLQSAVSVPAANQNASVEQTPVEQTQPAESKEPVYPDLFRNDLFKGQQNNAPQNIVPVEPEAAAPKPAEEPITPSLPSPTPNLHPSIKSPNTIPALTKPSAVPEAPTTQTPATTPSTQPTSAPTTPPSVPAAETTPLTPGAPPQEAIRQTPIFQPPTSPVVPSTTPPAVTPTSPVPDATPTTPVPGVTPLTPLVPSEINPQKPTTKESGSVAPEGEQPKTILINFNNVAITEYIRFISRISNKNFVFDENDLQFTVTIVSEEPTTIENIMTALLQELRIHDLELIEQDNTIIIHRNPKVTGISKVVPEDASMGDVKNADIVTKVFRLNTLEADRAAIILKPMVSATALVEVLKQTNHLIITDLATNIREISSLIKSLDSPQSGLVIGQYVATSQPPDSLIAIAHEIIMPIAQDQKVIFIPHRAANSIFVVSNPYLVERTIAILRYLDQTAATTQILNPKDLNFQTGALGQWILDKNGNWQFVPGPAIHGGNPPEGNWKIDDQGNWYFEPGKYAGGKGPDGKWVLDKNGNWVFQLSPGKSISPQKVQRREKITSELPVGHIERTQFSIYKLQYRKGEQIARALYRIADTLVAASAKTNVDLLEAINSVQWIESSNSLIFAGTAEAIAKMRELISGIDVPLRQVLLEMLILETDITDSLNFSTNVAARFGGGNTAGAEAFLSGASTLPAGIATSGIGLTPDAGPQIETSSLTGFVLGIIGQTITHNGTEFATLGALVKALTQRSISRIVMNPKILTEDNSPAELFVGLNTQFPTQSIANNLGTIVTQNFEFRDVGTTLKVTPMIGNNDIVTLEIQEEVSSIVSGGVTSSGSTSQVIGPTTKVNRTTTRVHVPNGFFLILSGTLSDTENRNRTQVPCLGSVPIIGAAFSDKQVQDTKQNLMIFVHPVIIDTEEEIDNITRHEQNVYRVKSRRPKEWTMETDEAMDFFNIINTENSDGTEDCY